MSKYRNNRKSKKRPGGQDILDSDLVTISDSLARILANKWGAPFHEIIEARDKYGLKYCPARDTLMTGWQRA